MWKRDVYDFAFFESMGYAKINKLQNGKREKRSLGKYMDQRSNFVLSFASMGSVHLSEFLDPSSHVYNGDNNI